VFQFVDFSSTNDLKFTYVRLQIQKFFPGVTPPDPHYKGRGRERRGWKGREKEGKEGEREKEGKEGVNPRNTNPGYGPGGSAPIERPGFCFSTSFPRDSKQLHRSKCWNSRIFLLRLR
jgi:hypothetical protein